MQYFFFTLLIIYFTRSSFTQTGSTLPKGTMGAGKIFLSFFYLIILFIIIYWFRVAIEETPLEDCTDPKSGGLSRLNQLTLTLDCFNYIFYHLDADESADLIETQLKNAAIGKFLTQLSSGIHLMGSNLL